FIGRVYIFTIVTGPAIVGKRARSRLLGEHDRVRLIGNINDPEVSIVNLRGPHGIMFNIAIMNIPLVIRTEVGRIHRICLQVQKKNPTLPHIGTIDIGDSILINPDSMTGTESKGTASIFYRGDSIRKSREIYN